MRMYRLIPILLVLTTLAFLLVAQGQNVSEEQATSSASSQYAQNRLLSREAPGIPFSTPESISIARSELSNLTSNNANAFVNSLWIQGETNLTHNIVVPVGSTANLIVISPTGGSGYLNEIYNSNMQNNAAQFYPNSQITFYADAIGEHVLYVMINGKPSNSVTIDVTGKYTQPWYYMSPYYTGYYPMYSYGHYWDYGDYGPLYYYGSDPWCYMC
jgi:hypothetical protein